MSDQPQCLLPSHLNTQARGWRVFKRVLLITAGAVVSAPKAPRTPPPTPVHTGPPTHSSKPRPGAASGRLPGQAGVLASNHLVDNSNSSPTRYRAQPCKRRAHTSQAHSTWKQPCSLPRSAEEESSVLEKLWDVCALSGGVSDGASYAAPGRDASTHGHLCSLHRALPCVVLPVSRFPLWSCTSLRQGRSLSMPGPWKLTP